MAKNKDNFKKSFQAKARKFDTEFSKLIENKGGPVTFHFVQEVEEELDNGKTRTVKKTVAKQVLNITDAVFERSARKPAPTPQEFIGLLESIKQDLGADSFTF